MVTPEEMVKTLADFANTYDTRSFRAVAEGMMGQHRTLQQSVFRLFLMMCDSWAALPEYHYDMRNEFTVQKSREIMAMLGGPAVPHF